MQMLISWIIVVAIIVTVGIIVFQGTKLLKNLALKDLFFTTVEEPEVKIILRGESPFDCISNVKGYTMVYLRNGGKKEDWILVSNQELADHKKDGWLKRYDIFDHESLGGYYLFGILPNKKIAEIKIDASRWVENQADIRSSISHETIPVKALRGKTERRSVFKNIEIGGESTLKIDVGITVIVVLRNPLIAAFDRKGKFGEIIDEAVKEVIVREALKLTDDSLFKSDKDTQIFDPKVILKELQDPNNNIHNSGYQAVAVIYNGFDFTPDSQTVVQEMGELKKAEYRRREKLEEAKAEKKTLELRGQGRASAIKNQVKAFTDLGVNPDVAAHIFGRNTAAEAVASKDSDISMWIEQGAGVQFAPGMIPQIKKGGTK